MEFAERTAALKAKKEEDARRQQERMDLERRGDVLSELGIDLSDFDDDDEETPRKKANAPRTLVTLTNAESKDSHEGAEGETPSESSYESDDNDVSSFAAPGPAPMTLDDALSEYGSPGYLSLLGKRDVNVKRGVLADVDDFLRGKASFGLLKALSVLDKLPDDSIGAPLMFHVLLKPLVGKREDAIRAAFGAQDNADPLADSVPQYEMRVVLLDAILNKPSALSRPGLILRLLYEVFIEVEVMNVERLRFFLNPHGKYKYSVSEEAELGSLTPRCALGRVLLKGITGLWKYLQGEMALNLDSWANMWKDRPLLERYALATASPIVIFSEKKANRPFSSLTRNLWLAKRWTCVLLDGGAVPDTMQDIVERSADVARKVSSAHPFETYCIAGLIRLLVAQIPGLGASSESVGELASICGGRARQLQRNCGFDVRLLKAADYMGVIEGVLKNA